MTTLCYCGLRTLWSVNTSETNLRGSLPNRKRRGPETAEAAPKGTASLLLPHLVDELVEVSAMSAEQSSSDIPETALLHSIGVIVMVVTFGSCRFSAGIAEILNRWKRHICPQNVHKLDSSSSVLSTRSFTGDGDPDALRVVERVNFISEPLVSSRAIIWKA